MEAEGVANLVRRVILELPTPGKKDGVWGLRKSTKLVLRELSSCRFSGQGTPLGIFSHHWQQRLASTRREGTSWDGGPRLAKGKYPAFDVDPDANQQAVARTWRLHLTSWW